MVTSGRSTDHSDDVDRLLRRAWPGGVPTEESAFLKSLPQHRREVVLSRLKAVLDAEHVAGVIEEGGGGLRRSAFHKLRREWGDRRSLSTLVPYARRDRPAADFVEPAAREGQTAMRQLAERAAAVEAIRADPAADNVTLAKRIALDLDSDLDPRTLVNLVRRERRLLHFKPTLLLGVYGRSLLADVSALDLAIRVDGGDRRAVVALLVERSSTLTLGYAVGLREDGLLLQRRAAERAVEALARWRADVPADTAVGMRLVVAPGDAGEVEAAARHAASVIGDDAVVWRGRLRFGRGAASLIGKPGRFAWKPARTMLAANVFWDWPLRSPPVSIDEAEILVGAELKRHDESALRGLRAVGLAGAGETRGAMAALITKVFRITPPDHGQ